MNEPNVFSNPCAICRRKEATRLCDYVVKYSNHVIFMRTWKEFQEANYGGHNETCDLPICPDCAKVVGHNVDLCPYHYELHLKAELPDHLKKAQLQSKAKLLKG